MAKQKEDMDNIVPISTFSARHRPSSSRFLSECSNSSSSSPSPSLTLLPNCVRFWLRYCLPQMVLNFIEIDPPYHHLSSTSSTSISSTRIGATTNNLSDNHIKSFSPSTNCTKQISRITILPFLSFVSAFLLLSCLILTLVNAKSNYSYEEYLIDQDAIKNVARTIGRELSSVSTEQTCLAKIEENFQNYSQEVTWFDGNKMMDDMRMDVENMLNWKKHAVERIANESERLASNHTYDKNIENIDYYNVKRIHDESLDGSDSDSRSISLTPKANYDYAPVNRDYSAIHVPVNVYERAPDIINDIKWSEALTQFFRNNLAFDPSLSWQFFGSAKGFFRLFPATPWKSPPSYSDKEQPDFFDCRMRQWYIRGAASPKDIVILLDHSGSMTGIRKDIAKAVVEQLLDTLTDDDYVAALKFSNVVTPINECFDQLVQANKRNIIDIKENLEFVKTSDFVNFTAALVEAFNLLQSYNRSGMGSQCNQAIMIVTDGAPNTYEDTFKQFNWPNIPVRVFTYLIGRDVTSHDEVYWMACHNRGYYTHVADLSEVHEQVQKYIPVMSRPIVLSGQRTFSWTPVYAHMSELELSEHVWESKLSYEKESKLRADYARQTQPKDDDDDKGQEVEVDQPPELPPDSHDIEEVSTEADVDNNGDELSVVRDKRNIRDPSDKNEEQEAINQHNENTDNIQAASYSSSDSSSSSYHRSNKRDKKKYVLFTTLSTPVFDTRNYTNITKRILIKNVYQDSEPETIRIANLLGVAGIDVPIKEIEKLTPAFKLGVNGYAFMISNNGFLLNHPDLRPYYDDFLKPFYKSVDMSEVELANNTEGPRVPDRDIESIRGNMINRTHGWKKVAVKVHINDMRRVVTRVNHYTYGMIGHTPFSIAIALPEPYGSYRLTSHVDLRMKQRDENFTEYFRGDKWLVHPDWIYCENAEEKSSEEQMMGNDDSRRAENRIIKFLSIDLTNEKQAFRWRTSSIRPQIYETSSCDKDLIQSLVLDAKLTNIPTNKCNDNPNFQDEKRVKAFGIVSTFVATRSGLTRFQDYGVPSEVPFYKEHRRAIEETYYQRAVDFYVANKDAFVYSVEFDVGAEFQNKSSSLSDANFLVTATHALFIGNGKQSTPVAVVGIQFRYSVLHKFFIDKTENFKLPCSYMDVDCYLVDNNGFVVISDKKVDEVGKFIGEIDGDILNELVNRGVYRRIHMYDYQAICMEKYIVSGPSACAFMFSFVANLFRYISNLFSLLATVYLNVLYSGGSYSDAMFSGSEPTYSHARQGQLLETTTSGQAGQTTASDSSKSKNRTIIRPCDKEFDLYEMMNFSNATLSHEIACSGNAACSKKYVSQYVPHTNLIMLMIMRNICDCPKKRVSIEPKEVHYNQQEHCRLLRTEKVRQRPTTCHNYHPQEKDIRQCGGASSLRSTTLLLASSTSSFTCLVSTVLIALINTLLYSSIVNNDNLSQL